MSYNRREIKQKAKASLKRHYLFFVVVCMIAVFFGTIRSSTVSSVNIPSARQKKTSETVVQTGTTNVSSGILDVVNGSSIGRLIQEKEVFGRRRGVFAALVNLMSSGTVVATLVSAVASLTGSESAGLVVVIILGLLVLLSVWTFVFNVYRAISARIFLEGRIYEKLPIDRFLFLARVNKWFHASMIMLLQSVFQMLWWLTVVGGVIKEYSYRMVPYIVAENPTISPLKAITLSRKMMDGHKWECFKLDLTLFGWQLLRLFTLNFAGYLFVNPYMEAVFGEYYAYVRAQAKEKNIPGSEALNDTYLFEKAGQDRLKAAYGNVERLAAEAEKGLGMERQTGVRGFFEDVFGIAMFSDNKERLYESAMTAKVKAESLRDEFEGKAYPGRLYPIPEEERKMKIQSMHYMRHYSVWSLIMLFFAFSLIGWLWEVSLHLVSDGVFVNRGVMHGPWLPIYGAGGVMILILLNKFRSKPVLEFVTAVILCGSVEYFTSWFLQVTHDGRKWWDYSGYFLNLNGRICAEGLLVFGVGGMAIVYLAAPLLDNLVKKINRKVLIPVCLLLVAVFAADQVYSHSHPNTGKGITDYASADMMECFATRGRVLPYEIHIPLHEAL